MKYKKRINQSNMVKNQDGVVYGIHAGLELCDKSPRIHWDVNKVSQSLRAAAAALTGDGWRCTESCCTQAHALCSSPHHPS